MRFTIAIEDNLINEAKKTIGARTKKQTIETALKELIRKRNLKEAVQHAGKIEMTMTVDELIEQRTTQ